MGFCSDTYFNNDCYITLEHLCNKLCSMYKIATVYVVSGRNGRWVARMGIRHIAEDKDRNKAIIKCVEEIK